MKFPRPPAWVVDHYFTDYLVWVARVGSPDKETGLQQAPLPWADLLGINPRWDFWRHMEEVVYGECLLAEEVPRIADYFETRERRLRLA